MTELRLTKDAKKALAKIYKEYTKRRQNGMPKNKAAYLDADVLRSMDDDVFQNIPELKRAGLASMDILGSIMLKDDGIIFMENQTADTIKECLSFVSQFIP